MAKQNDMVIKVIKNDAEYELALAAIETLIDSDPDPGTSDAERLELLHLLVEDYETKIIGHDLPDALEAIRFRMEQQGLRQRDLIPFIGSRSKVSEILAGKRPLTLSMIRALHQGLGIPAGVLLQERSSGSPKNTQEIDFTRFPLTEMFRRGWLSGVTNPRELQSRAAELVQRFIEPVGSTAAMPVLYRKSRHLRSKQPVDDYALAAWTVRVMTRGLAESGKADYDSGSITPAFMRELARLSWSEQGPRVGIEFLARHGIPVIIEPALPGTHLDGAAILLETGRPVIGMTLRYDRLDNFWFCLLHEVAHVALHLRLGGENEFLDDLDADAGGDSRESEADAAAGEALIPESAWQASPARVLRTTGAITSLANDLRIHPAIVAGRIRHQYSDFRILGELIGQGMVRKHFPENRWT